MGGETGNHIVCIVMDSCRFDSFMAAKTPNIDRIGKAERRYSYASWTAPSHNAFAMGLFPHASPTKVLASEVYKDEYNSTLNQSTFFEVRAGQFGYNFGLDSNNNNTRYE